MSDCIYKGVYRIKDTVTDSEFSDKVFGGYGFLNHPDIRTKGIRLYKLGEFYYIFENGSKVSDNDFFNDEELKLFERIDDGSITDEMLEKGAISLVRHVKGDPNSQIWEAFTPLGKAMHKEMVRSIIECIFEDMPRTNFKAIEYVADRLRVCAGNNNAKWHRELSSTLTKAIKK